MRAQLGAVRAQQTAQRTSIVASSTSRLNAPAIRLNRPADKITLGSVGFVSVNGTLRNAVHQQRSQLPSRRVVSPTLAARDPDALDGGDDDVAANQGPPTLFWRVFAALCYLVPWIDSISLGREIYRRFRNLIILYLVPGPLAKVYFSSQFAPLIIFFVMFLSIVKNKKLHHFVRFNCMQAIMLDIVVMLFHIVRAYLPAEAKWSALAHFVDMFAWTTCMGTIAYAVFWTLRATYADLPFVSESVYHQVALSEYA